jgi:hypothetical protein
VLLPPEHQEVWNFLAAEAKCADFSDVRIGNLSKTGAIEV